MPDSPLSNNLTHERLKVAYIIAISP